MTEFKPTDEQLACFDAIKSGENTVITAGAGCGKTTVCKKGARLLPRRKGVAYLAFNRSIADEAKASFPGNTTANTFHAFAMGAVGRKYQARLKGQRVTARQAAQILGIRNAIEIAPQQFLNATAQARMVMDGLARYCQSADPMPEGHHIPYQPGCEHIMDGLRLTLLPFLRKAWADIQLLEGKLRFTHDHYLKMWALTEPVMEFDVLMVDEAQDCNPVKSQIVAMQDGHAQIITVGDKNQQIYAWSGAVDAMDAFNAKNNCALTQSFRFGPAVADEANKWLTLLDADIRLRGFDQIKSEVMGLDNPKATLCRTNAEAVAQAIAAQEDGSSYALVGGTEAIKRFGEAALDLMAGKGTWHPELAAFQTWAQVQEYVEEEGGGDIATLVKIVDAYGPQRVIEIAEKAVTEQFADRIISTAHKAKGREWTSVKIGNDFKEPEDDNEISKPECMLAYVSVTRAMKQLDVGSLGWVDRRLDMLTAPKRSERPINPWKAKIEKTKAEHEQLTLDKHMRRES